MQRVEAMRNEPQNTSIEKELRDSFAFLYDFFEYSIEPIIVTDSSGLIVFVNGAACRLFRASKDKMMDSMIEDLFSGAIASCRNQDWHRQDDGTEIHLEVQLSDGEIKHLTSSYSQSQGYRVIRFTDVTAEKENEQERQLVKTFFGEMFRHSADGVIIYDSFNRILEVNDSFTNMAGVLRRDIIGRKLSDFFSDEMGLSDKAGIWTEGKSSGEIWFIGSSKKTRLEYKTSAGYNGSYLTIFKNTEEKTRMIKKLEKSEKITQELLDQSMDAIIFWKQGGKIIQVNDAACKIFESPMELLVGSPIDQFVKKDSKFREMNRIFQEKGAVRGELLYKMPNGQIKLLELAAKAHDAEGYNLTIFRNVTERRIIETELRKSEKKFRRIFEGSLDGMILWKPSEIMDVNEAALKILEMDRNALIGKSIKEITCNKGMEKLLNHIDNVFKHGMDTANFPVACLSSAKNLEISTRENLYSGLNLTILRDITEKLEMQEQIRKSDTLSVVGELAAGIAHEIRNPMTAMKGFIQLLESSIQDDFSTYFYVINTELQRIESIITEFLVLAKPQAVRYSSQDVKGIMKETLDLMAAQALLKNVQFEQDWEGREYNVYCEANQLKQVFINMIKNAIESMSKGGTVHIKITEEVRGHIRVTIKDEGGGISKEKIKKLGEPFYTTKERGTGLGLMVSYKIIEEHKGTIEVESEEGNGTAFSISLPRSAAK